MAMTAPPTRDGTVRGTVDWPSLCSPAELSAAGRALGEPGAAPRTMTATDTMLRVEPYLADYGITRVAHLTFLDRVGIPVHTAHKPAGRTLSNGSGKGATEEASRIGAMMEAIEQAYWEECVIPRLRISDRDLTVDRVAHIDPRDLPMNRGNLWNPGLAIPWTPMTDMADGTEVLVPADVVGLPPAHGGTSIADTHICGSNGLASGNNFVEAVLSGLTEVMERDAVAMAHAMTAERSPVQCLDLDVLRARMGEPLVSLLEAVERAGLHASVQDRTGDLGLPTYTCRISEKEGSGAGTFGGYGASPDPMTAVVRAVTEAAQARVLLIAGARDDNFRCGRDAALLTSRHFRSGRPEVTLEPVERPDLSTGSLVRDVEQLVGMLRAQGMPRVLVHRYSAPTDPVQVVRVVVPGLEGYRFANYQPGPRAAAVLAAQGGDPA